MNNPFDLKNYKPIIDTSEFKDRENAERARKAREGHKKRGVGWGNGTMAPLSNKNRKK